MAERTFDMDHDDWSRITDIVNNAVEPLHKRLNGLPCVEHTVKLNTIEIEHEMEKKQEKEGKDSRDWILRVAVGIMGLLVFLDKIGVFRAIQK